MTTRCHLMLLRLAYLGITNAFTLLRLLPGGDHDKDIEILSLRHQLAVLRRQVDGQQVRFEPVDRARLAALLHPLPRPPAAPAVAGAARHGPQMAP
jgi:hypothetical protein